MHIQIYIQSEYGYIALHFSKLRKIIYYTNLYLVHVYLSKINLKEYIILNTNAIIL